ncbi:MAG TPA: NAD(P)/FAD-dependent oxidoreductase [Polyangiales bacterium]|nr:NAD(P)/FAD-dependent oxidoreductase [Polyangiales bacterium]
MFDALSAGSMDPVWDVIIVGGGPAGLNAALLLGRCRRSVLLIDDGKPRNGVSHASHGVFTRDGEAPGELRRIAREQLRLYGVVVQEDTVVRARCAADTFEIDTANGDRQTARKLLLATGLVDKLPDVPGLESCYGRSVFSCPYCDGWEVRDRPLAVLAQGRAGIDLALGLTTWSRDLVLCTNGWSRLSQTDRHALRAHAVALRTARVVRIDQVGGYVERIVFADGQMLPRSAIFIATEARQRSDLARALGCEFNLKGAVNTGKLQRAGPYGLFVAGDAAREANFIGVAAAEGLKAAYAINLELREEFSARLRAQSAQPSAAADARQ